jgi:transcriptional regulator with GAF, ATPase, and Fis domain
MRALCETARQVAQADVPVLISGETGTGKEVLAQAIHGWSPRVDGPFVSLNCAAIPMALVESELFGHVKGAFSGADRDRQGRFRTADRGTLFLDEVAELPLEAQAKLLRVLQERTLEPVGSDRTVQVDVRVLAASHVHLEAAVKAGRFREDLYWRLAVFPLVLPPLRERPEDIAAIVDGLLRALERRGQRGPWSLHPDSLAALHAEPWPGNVRQLVNTIERATILCPVGAILPHHLGLGPAAPRPRPIVAPAPILAPPADAPFPTLAEQERVYLQAALDRAGGRIYGPGGAAQLAGLAPSTLQSRMERLGMRRGPGSASEPA